MAARKRSATQPECKNFGAQLLFKAICEPARQIVRNAGRDEDTVERIVRQMKQANMQFSAAELTRSLGIRIEGKLTVQRWQDALRHADGRARFTAEYGWEL